MADPFNHAFRAWHQAWDLWTPRGEDAPPDPPQPLVCEHCLGSHGLDVCPHLDADGVEIK